MIRFAWPLLALFTLALPAWGVDSIAPRGGEAPRSIGSIDFEQKLGEQVPLALTFRDEEGKPITLEQCVNGKPTILVLAYYRCPQVCTQVLNNLAEYLRKMPLKLGDDYNVITVSFDPKEHEQLAAEKKKSYIQTYNIPGMEKGWHFLTGEKAAIDQLCDAVGLKIQYDKVFKEYKHATGLMVLTPEGKLSRYFYGIEYSDDPKLSRNLRLSLVEASDGKIGSPMDKLILTCYTWDHKTSAYSFNIMMAVKIGGALTLLVVVLGVSFAFLRERRHRLAAEQIAKSTPETQLTEGAN